MFVRNSLTFVIVHLSKSDGFIAYGRRCARGTNSPTEGDDNNNVHFACSSDATNEANHGANAAAVAVAPAPVAVSNGPASAAMTPSGAAAAAPSVSPLERLDNLIKGSYCTAMKRCAQTLFHLTIQRSLLPLRNTSAF